MFRSPGIIVVDGKRFHLAVASLGTRHETAVDANRGGREGLWESGQPCSAEHAVPSPLQQPGNQY